MTARERLQKSAQVKDVAAMVQSGLFEHCCDVALLTLAESLASTGTADAMHAASQQYQLMHAASQQYQLQGAKRILAILKDLATIPSEPKPNRIGQLGPQ